MLRTHTCGALRKSDVGSPVTLCGWVDSKRDHGGAVFIDLRDRYGLTQVVIGPPEANEALIKQAGHVPNESVILIRGVVADRLEGKTNAKLETGEIEVRSEHFEILSASETPPFTPGQSDLPGEDLRLKYRFLDLRRKEMQQALIRRSEIIKCMRDYFAEHDFIDVETPILGRSTPEGARDYLVPSRVHPSNFYALPQSPQLYKQILMVAGFDRYVQVAKCFRDEDLRADRQPEFTQLDLEMSFVDSEDIIGLIDGLVAKTAKQVLGKDITLPLPRMTYEEAMRRFGSDAPDLRFGLEIVDVTSVAAKTDFRVFRGTADAGNFVRGINVKDSALKFSRRQIDELTAFVQQDFGAKGLAWFRVEDDGTLWSPIAKNFDEEHLAEIKALMGGEPGDLLMFLADTWEVTCKGLSGLRKRLAVELKLYEDGELNCSWVTEFPMFEKDEEAGRYVAMHHPFTAPLEEDLPLLKESPEKCRAQAYDLVINGSEAGGGTIRIHDSKVQSQVFELLGMDEETARDRFGFLLDALRFGAPPHGGIALGVDRWVMLFAGLENIREVIAFPKTQKAADMMTGAPGEVDADQLNELHLRTVSAKT
ncbi:aspartate--tRNA ligase [Rhodopirellula baltica]|uniref:Aspartate--tRNA(Asp/Asn) ligase n=1 Tax=Rhodopirellula baltica (strain DSM 10527 / NCIMB 13988 / SH1) TaxID=243090 RepID=SYDND_RHOBA|nr:aspartate--tRNA ligase [Rhodopirellula baltica]Q7UFY6.1 RecName: Full=Aspartate--tRNA(Asp/Asn) ligase; AltName: Full=Aspartyl-tRNA synthetase; Short=AspRS; AltName: Full=Non-discriminating aspartyl-tRNA synthetase; Short=ND-AspRS [Rhodopirellula baltica SH 1]CAD78543.1 Aspartyl-tRNA synthetase [Rhodopirellula baltica SH 1]HBE61940.1 aspartate--tRNA ligase [Rhodopirellula baltica]